MTLPTLNAMLAYAEQFEHALVVGATAEDFAQFLAYMAQDANTLDKGVSARIVEHLELLTDLPCIMRRHPDLRNTVVVPAIHRMAQMLEREIRELDLPLKS